MSSETADSSEIKLRRADAEEGTIHLRLLIVDDDAKILRVCRLVAEDMGFTVYTATDVPAAQDLLRSQAMDVLLLDMKLPGPGDLSLLEEMRISSPRTNVIVMTAYATVSSAVEAMRIGANDYLTKPFAMDELAATLERAAQQKRFHTESRALRELARSENGVGMLVGRSPEMERLYRIVSKVALAAHPVLILGESGTGKEKVARAIHSYGPNASQPFLPIDCSSLVSSLMETELFGHVKGAFTGAEAKRTGLLVAAGVGTVFLDEIGELPMDLQAKLLRALQEKEVRPVGSTEVVPIRARILAATNRDLTAMVGQGRFRKDLYFRLNVVNLRIPPLRARREDIPLLAEFFLQKLRSENGVDYTLSEETLRTFISYDWPGNVRELENAVERACALSSGPVLHIGDLPSQLQNHGRRADHEEAHGEVKEGDARRASYGVLTPSTAYGQIVPIAEMEKQAILNTMRQLNGDKLMAARLLGIGKTTLYRKLKEYGISDKDD